MITKNVPGANAETIVHADATDFCQLVITEQLPAVLKTFCAALDKIFCFGAGISVAAFIFGFGLGWKEIRGEHKSVNQAKSEEVATQEKTESTG